MNITELDFTPGKKYKEQHGNKWKVNVTGTGLLKYNGCKKVYEVYPIYDIRTLLERDFEEVI